MRSVLIIDDEESVATVLAETIGKAFPDVRCVVETNFAKAVQVISDLEPDAIVLDLMEGVQSSHLPGQVTWDSVWNKQFCPIVIHTGSEDELIPAVPAGHP